MTLFTTETKIICHPTPKLREARRALKLTIKTVAKAAGISEPYLGSVELGHATCPLETMTKIEEALRRLSSEMRAGVIREY